MIPRGFDFYFFILFSFVMFSCPTENTGNNEENNNNNGNNNNGNNNNLPATVYFYNDSTFTVDIYKNLNPDYFDPTTLVCTVNQANTEKVTLYASADQKIGDTFYPRYKVLLADSVDTGTTNIRVDAQRNLSNINFVVESGKTYTKTIPQPQADDLKFVNGYIEVQNMGPTQVQILMGDTLLYKLDDKGAQLPPGQNMGYYEVAISSFYNSLHINQLKAFSSSYMDFPAFEMERGKVCKYRFTINNTTITGPVVINLNPMR